MTFVKLTLGGEEFHARLLTDRAPEAVARVRAALPLRTQLAQDIWSGAILLGTDKALPNGALGDSPAAFQYPGLLALEQHSGRLAICYGQGRLQDGGGPVPPVPVAEVTGDLERFVDACSSVQFDGGVTLELAETGESPSADEVRLVGPRIGLQLGSARATAVLLEQSCPQLTRLFASGLPLEGRVTNTHSGGPLTRFWNHAGGKEGETPLGHTAEEEGLAQAVLYPGHIYYQMKPPWRGLRMALQDATVMRNAVAGGALRLLPLARLEGDWHEVAEQARLLATKGAQPMRIWGM